MQTEVIAVTMQGDIVVSRKDSGRGAMLVRVFGSRQALSAFSRNGTTRQSVSFRGYPFCRYIARLQRSTSLLRSASLRNRLRTREHIVYNLLQGFLTLIAPFLGYLTYESIISKFAYNVNGKISQWHA